MTHIYTFKCTSDPKERDDGWYAVPSEKVFVEYDQAIGKRGRIDHVKQAKLHFFKDGKSYCGKYPSIPNDAHMDNNPAGYCSDCLVGLRKQIAHGWKLRDANGGKGDESENVIDWKAIAAKDKPQTSKTSHEATTK